MVKKLAMYSNVVIPLNFHGDPPGLERGPKLNLCMGKQSFRHFRGTIADPPSPENGVGPVDNIPSTDEFHPFWKDLLGQ